MGSSKLNIKQVLLTAFITCVFTVIAGIATYLFTNSRASLTYAVTSGPTLSSGNLHKRIYSIHVTNTGRKEVDNASLQVNIEKGKIEEVAAELSPGLKVNETKTDNEYLIIAPSINPKETIAASLMVCLDSPDSVPVFSVRGKGINGTVEEKKETKKTNIIFLIIGSLASLLGVIASIAPITRRIAGRALPNKMVEAFVRRDSMVGPFDRNELVAYILGLCGLTTQSNQIRFSPSEISFRGAADFILAGALSAETDEDKSKFILALKCMLLIKTIAPESLQIIYKGLQSLAQLTEADLSKIREVAVDQFENPAGLRTALFTYAKSKGSEFLQQITSADGENDGGVDG